MADTKALSDRSVRSLVDVLMRFVRTRDLLRFSVYRINVPRPENFADVSLGRSVGDVPAEATEKQSSASSQVQQCVFAGLNCICVLFVVFY